MAEIKLIDFLKAELNSFSGDEMLIEDCNRITIRLWKMSNSNFQLCSEAINNLKSKNEKIDFFKTHALSYLSKLSNNSNTLNFEYKLKTSNNTLSSKPTKSQNFISKIKSRKLFLIPFTLIVLLLLIYLLPMR